MTIQTEYKHWHYQFVHYVPFTPEGGGEIEWNKITDYREIFLPIGVLDPARHLQRCGSDDFTDLLEYDDFTALS